MCSFKKIPQKNVKNIKNSFHQSGSSHVVSHRGDKTLFCHLEWCRCTSPPGPNNRRISLEVVNEA